MDQKVSVIIPVHNSALWLNKCLASVCKQSFRNLEIIIVEDSSTDDSANIVRNFKDDDERIRIISGVFGSPASARNAALKEMTGDFVFFVDSDDVVDVTAVESMMKAMADYSCDIVTAPFFYYFPDHLELSPWFDLKSAMVYDGGDAIRELVNNKIINDFLWGKLFRRCVIGNILFGDYVLYEDKFWMHHVVGNAERLVVLPNPLYYYRQSSTSLTGRNKENLNDLVAAEEDRLAYISNSFPASYHIALMHFWNLAYQRLFFDKEDSSRELWREINGKYTCEVLKIHPLYIKARLAKYGCGFSLKVIRFFERVRAHFTAKRPVRLPVPEFLS